MPTIPGAPRGSPGSVGLGVAGAHAHFLAGEGQSLFGLYTVPYGKTAYVSRGSLSATSTKTPDVRFLKRENADVVAAPFEPKRVQQFVQATVGYSSEFDALLGPYPAKTDLWVEAKAQSGTSSVSCSWDMYLVSD